MNLFIFFGILALAYVSAVVGENLSRIKAYFRLYRLRQYRRSATRQIDAKARILAEKRMQFRGVVS